MVSFMLKTSFSLSFGYNLLKFLKKTTCSLSMTTKFDLISFPVFADASDLILDWVDLLSKFTKMKSFDLEGMDLKIYVSMASSISQATSLTFVTQLRTRSSCSYLWSTSFKKHLIRINLVRWLLTSPFTGIENWEKIWHIFLLKVVQLYSFQSEINLLVIS